MVGEAGDEHCLFGESCFNSRLVDQNCVSGVVSVRADWIHNYSDKDIRNKDALTELRKCIEVGMPSC